MSKKEELLHLIQEDGKKKIFVLFHEGREFFMFT